MGRQVEVALQTRHPLAAGSRCRLFLVASCISLAGACVADDNPPSTGTETGTGAGGSTGGTTTTSAVDSTGPAADDTSMGPGSCEPVECPTQNPCQAVECCDPRTGCTPVFHDSQVLGIWALGGCDGCHEPETLAAGLSLVAEDDPWCSLIDVAGSSPSPLVLVAPGQPLESYLWHKLNGSHLCSGVGGDQDWMAPPPASCAYAQEDPLAFDALTQWICCGAPKNARDPSGDECFSSDATTGGVGSTGA